MDPRDYASQYSGQPAYAQYGTTSSPYTSTAPYSQQYYSNTSSGSEHGSYDHDAATSPVDDVRQRSQRGSRAGSSAASGGSSSTTSARRREQNRLAQRALRQRRDTHIRTLEDRILQSSLETRHLASENQELSQQLQNVRLENDLYRRTSVEAPHVAGARAGVTAASTNPYPHGAYGMQQPVAYAGANSSYQNYACSAASTPSSAGDPSPAGAAWPYDDPTAQAQYDPSYWQQTQQHPAGYAQQHQQQYVEEAGDESEEDEQEEQRPVRGYRRRK